MEQRDPNDPVETYIREVSNIAPLTQDEQTKLFRELGSESDWNDAQENVARRLILRVKSPMQTAESISNDGAARMARTNSPEGLFSHGYSLEAVKEWRAGEHEAGRPSGLDDFLRAHHLCVECRGNGKFAIGVRWRDGDGIERAEEGPVAGLVQQHALESPAKWLSDTRKWDYLYQPCESCGGTGTTA